MFIRSYVKNDLIIFLVNFDRYCIIKNSYFFIECKSCIEHKCNCIINAITWESTRSFSLKTTNWFTIFSFIAVTTVSGNIPTQIS